MPTKNKPDNLLQFPAIHSNPPINEDQVRQKIKDYKDSYSTELAEIIWENVLGEMARAGCDFDSDMEKYFPSMVLIFESIKSLHLLTMNEKHQLQEYANRNVLIMDNTDPGIFAGGMIRKKSEETIDIDEDLD